MFLALFFALWAVTRPWYNRLLAGALNLLLPVLEVPPLTEHVAALHGDFLIVCKALARPFAFHGDYHFGNVLFAALVFASLPGRTPGRRAVIVVLGMVVLFASNLLEFYSYLQTYYAMPGDAGPVIARSFAYPRGIFRWFGVVPRDFFNYASAVMKLGERFFPLLLWVFVHFACRRTDRGPRA